MRTALSAYHYTGPLSGASLTLGEHTLDVMLYPSTTVHLPPEHDYTRALIAQGFLQPIAGNSSAASAPAPTNPKKGK